MKNHVFDANKESQFGVLPTLREERPYNSLDNSYINIGFAIATWCFLIGGTLSLFVGFWTSVIATIAGNMTAVLIMIMGTTLPGAKYGTDNYTNANSYLGKNGTYILMACIVVFQIAWIIVLSIMFARSVDNVASAAFHTKSMGNVFVGIMSVIAVLFVWLIVWKGPLVMKTLNAIVAPMLIIVMAGMLIIISNDIGWESIVRAEPLAPFESPWVNFLIAFELNLGAGLSWWPNMGGMARLCKSAKAAFWPNIVGLVIAATIGTAIGVAAALTIGSSDPTEWMIPLGGIFLGIIALLFVAIANLTSNSIVVYNMCLGLKTLKFFHKKNWGTIVMIFLVPVIIGLLIWPSQIYDNFYILLGITCTFYCPLVAVNFVDYFIFRKQNLSVRDLYNRTETSKYYFWKGFNWVAIFIFVIGMPFYLLFLNPITLAYREPFIYVTASGGSVLFSGILYYVLGKALLVKKSVGGYKQEMPDKLK
jgi:NCS1 family nucleobase:cation symporter-1